MDSDILASFDSEPLISTVEDEPDDDEEDCDEDHTSPRGGCGCC